VPRRRSGRPPQLAAPIGRNLLRAPCVFQVEPSQQVAPSPYTRVPETPPRWESDPAPLGIPGGVLVLANDMPPMPGAVPFVGNQTNGARVGLFSSAEREAEMWGAPPCAISLPQPTGSTTGFVGM
jgi:hypothetical protein